MIVLQWHNSLIINVFLSLTSSSVSLLLELLVLLLQAACHRFPAIGRSLGRTAPGMGHSRIFSGDSPATGLSPVTVPLLTSSLNRTNFRGVFTLH